MEWRIRKTSRGDYVAEYGAVVENQPYPFGIGHIMSCFYVYVYSKFDTVREAEQYIKEHPMGY